MDQKTLDQCLYEINIINEEDRKRDQKTLDQVEYIEESMIEKRNAYIMAETEEKLQRVMNEIRELLYNNGCMLDGNVKILDMRTGARYGYQESNATRFRR